MRWLSNLGLETFRPKHTPKIVVQPRSVIDESQVTFLEDMMWERGFLEARQMAGAFEMLRSEDLIWSRSVHNHLMGERSTPIDIMAWNADAMRMPYRMHSQYRWLLLKNDLAEGWFEVGDRSIALAKIRYPMLIVATERPRVALAIRIQVLPSGRRRRAMRETG